MSSSAKVVKPIALEDPQSPDLDNSHPNVESSTTEEVQVSSVEEVSLEIPTPPADSSLQNDNVTPLRQKKGRGRS